MSSIGYAVGGPIGYPIQTGPWDEGNAAGGGSTTPLLDTATAYWRAIDYSGSGDWLDGTGGGRDGVITSATHVDNGDETTHFLFDGINDVITVSHHADLDPDSGDFTALCVFEHTATANGSRLLAKEGTSPYWFMQLAGGSANRGRSNIFATNLGDALGPIGGYVPPNVATYAMRINRTTEVMDGLFDGTIDATDADISNVGAVTSASTLTFGSNGSGANWLTGKIYGVAIFMGTALSDANTAAGGLELRGL